MMSLPVMDSTHLPGQYPNPMDSTPHGQQADGTHPTGMLSCFYIPYYIVQSQKSITTTRKEL